MQMLKVSKCFDSTGAQQKSAPSWSSGSTLPSSNAAAIQVYESFARIKTHATSGEPLPESRSVRSGHAGYHDVSRATLDVPAIASGPLCDFVGKHVAQRRGQDNWLVDVEAVEPGAVSVEDVQDDRIHQHPRGEMLALDAASVECFVDAAIFRLQHALKPHIPHEPGDGFIPGLDQLAVAPVDLANLLTRCRPREPDPTRRGPKVSCAGYPRRAYGWMHSAGQDDGWSGKPTCSCATSCEKRAEHVATGRQPHAARFGTPLHGLRARAWSIDNCWMDVRVHDVYKGEHVA